MKTQNELIKILSSKYITTKFRTSEDFNNSVGGIWICGGEPTNSKGRIFNYYATKKNYELGVQKSFIKSMEKIGWLCEWYDCGTMFLWPNK